MKVWSPSVLGFIFKIGHFDEASAEKILKSVPMVSYFQFSIFFANSSIQKRNKGVLYTSNLYFLRTKKNLRGDYLVVQFIYTAVSLLILRSNNLKTLALREARREHFNQCWIIKILSLYSISCNFKSLLYYRLKYWISPSYLEVKLSGKLRLKSSVSSEMVTFNRKIRSFSSHPVHCTLTLF